MDYAEMSDKLVNLLRLEGKPIAVSLIKREEDIPGDLSEIESPRRYCQMLQDARFKDTVSLATVGKHACFIKKLKDENQSEQQQNQAFNALAWTRVFLFRQILFAFYSTTRIE